MQFSLPHVPEHKRWILPWALYCFFVLLILPRHEPWFDEAQAWLLARDAPWSQLMWRFMRYEGTPALWHTLLRPLAACGLPYWTMHAFSGTLGIFAAYLWMRHAPVPAFLRYLVPFTYFLFYQYVVVARNYSLMAPLMFLAAIAHRRRREKFLSYTAILLLLSQTSLHAALVAGTLFALALWEVRNECFTWDRATQAPYAKAFLLFSLNTLFIAAQLWPAKDVVGPPVIFDWLAFPIATFQMMNGFLTEIPALSLFVLGMSLIWFYRQKVLALYLIPTSALLVLFALLYGKPWHEGTLLLVWLFSLWVSFDKETAPVAKQEAHLFHIALASFLAIHLYWSFCTYVRDFTGDYSGAKKVAEFIQKNKLEDKKIFGTGFQSPVISPYFSKNILANYNAGQKPAFFWWSKNYNFNDNPWYIQEKKPDYVIMALKFQPGLKIPRVPGYRILKGFPGLMFWKDRVHENESYILLRREDVFPETVSLN